MDTEQPASESEVSIESRLGALFGGGETVKAEAPSEQPAPEPVETTSEAEEGEEVSGDDELIDFEADDGSTLRVPAKAKDALLRHADYTRKTMQLADLTKLATDKLQFAEAREQLSSAVLEDLTEYRALEKELAQYKQIDWGMLYESNPAQAFGLQQKRQDLETRVREKQSEIHSKAEGIQKASAKHTEFQWENASAGARKMIGEITAAENVAMAHTVRALGFSEAEFKSRFADPRIIAAVHKAAKWDSLQAGKSTAVAKATNAPPIVKPGASKGAAVVAEQKYKDVRSSLKKSGSLNDAAKLFVMRGLK